MLKKKKTVDIAVTAFILALIVSLSLVVYLVPTDKIIPVSAPFYNGKKGVSLMFNVYQNTECVIRINEILNDHGVAATFFIGGVWAKKNCDTLKMISERHEIGSHGYSHYDHKFLDKNANEKEILKSVEIIESIVNKNVVLFAPPSGSYGDDCIKACDELGLTIVMWSKDTIDWRDQNADIITQRALKDIKEGDLILMHPTPSTVQALPTIIEGVLASGLTIRIVSENVAN